jgi:hypothetical protein
MKLSLEKVLAKIDHPPFVHNFARLVGGDPNITAKNIVAFAKGVPPFSYQPAYEVIRDRIQFGIDLEGALSAIIRKGPAAGKVHNEALVRGFFAWDEQRRYSAANIVGFEKQWFRVSRDLLVPVAPLIVLRENGRFLPIFLCGWGRLGFNLLQSRLYLTICDDAFLSLEDFRSSEAEFLFFPQMEMSSAIPEHRSVPTRKPEIWRRDQFPLLSRVELNETIECYVEGLALAKRELVQAYEADRGGPSTPFGGGPSPDQPNLL